MPQASITHTRFPRVAVVNVFGLSAEEERSTEASAPLGAACQEAAITHAAITALSLSVASLPPEDPRHTAAYAAADLLQPRWRDQVARAVRLPAEGPSGFRLKAALLTALVERDADDVVIGGPALQIAASLADDLLAHEWS